MIRHYKKSILHNISGAIPLSGLQLVWDLPPRVVAGFCGEIAQVMLEAAEAYINRKCLARQTQIFKETAFHTKSLS